MALHHRIIQHATSSQSHVIVAAVLLSFLVWVTLQGHLGRYLADLGIGKPAPAPGSQAAMNTPGVAQGMGGLIGGGLGTLLPPLPSIATPPIFGN